MPKAVRYDRFGGIDVLYVADIPTPTPGPDQVLVKLRATAVNPGEAPVREGRFAEQWPSTFPSGQGSDLAGTVEAVGEAVEGVDVGDEVIGFTDERAAQAEYVVVDPGNLTAKPPELSWEAAGSLYVAGTTAWIAVRTVDPQPDEVVVVSGAAGGVGSLAVQLARRTGATVLGIASAANHDWLRAHGVVPIAYGDGLADRLRTAAPRGIDAFIDLYGSGYVALAVDELGIRPERVETIIDFGAVPQYGAQGVGMSAVPDPVVVIAELAELVARGELELPVAATYTLDEVQAAYTELEKRHTRGKIVLLP